MSTFVLRSSAIFPVGTVVSLFPGNARNRSEPKLGPPVGAAITTATVAADGSLTFVGLQPGRSYDAFATGLGYVEFQAPKASDFTEADASEFETIPAAEAVTNIASPASGTLLLAGGIILPAGRKISRIGWKSGTTAGATMTNQWLCLISQISKRVLAVTADDTSAAWAASSVKELAVAAPYVPPADIPVWVGRLVAGTTPPSSSGQTLLDSSAEQGGTADTGLTTPLAVGFQIGAITPLASQPYGYVRGGTARNAAA